MRSVMRHNFSNVPQIEIPRSRLDRSHGHKTTFDAGYLVPIFLDEALPGDTFNLNMHGFARLATPTFPIMDNMYMDTFFFAVPYRLVWENWQKFCGERTDPADDIEYSVPQVTYTNWDNMTLADYFGLPTKINTGITVSALPWRSYNLIYNEWFRDENLQDSVEVERGNGPEGSAAAYTLLRRGKRHDYFTSCLPWLQKGDAVQLALGDKAPIMGIGVENATFGTSGKQVNETLHAGTTFTQSKDVSSASANTSLFIEEDPDNSGLPGIYANLNEATASTVNELRQAVQVQRLLERDARSGSRYTEIVQSHFGVTSPDARLQRPEYLGGGSTPILINAVPRTDSSPGELGAVGIAAFHGHGFTHSFTEHCIVMGLVNVRADLTYQEGIERMWTRLTRYDFYWPTLAHLGEQAVLNKEIYVDATDLGDGTSEEVFGYQERYAEYRYKPSRITGKMRSNDAASLDAWHLGIEFGDTPTLDDTFIKDDPPLDRCIAVPTEPHFIFDSFFDLQCTRPMPVYSVPGLIDHF